TSCGIYCMLDRLADEGLSEQLALEGGTNRTLYECREGRGASRTPRGAPESLYLSDGRRSWAAIVMWACNRSASTVSLKRLMSPPVHPPLWRQHFPGHLR